MKYAVYYGWLALFWLVALAACTTTPTPLPTTPAQKMVPPSAIGDLGTPTPIRSIVPSVTPPPTSKGPTSPLASGPGDRWIRRQFAKAWDIEYPEGWTANEAGLSEGNLELRGAYGGHKYQVTLGYPIFQRPAAAQSLDAWIEDELAALTSAQRRVVQIKTVTVAGTPAKKVLNLPEKTFDDGVTRRYAQQLTHAGYISRRNDKNPGVIAIKEISTTPLDAQQMEAVLDRLLAGIR